MCISSAFCIISSLVEKEEKLKNGPIIINIYGKTQTRCDNDWEETGNHSWNRQRCVIMIIKYIECLVWCSTHEDKRFKKKTAEIVQFAEHRTKRCIFGSRKNVARAFRYRGPDRLSEKALLFNEKLGGNSDFKALSGLERFKNRHGIRELNVQGEKLSATSIDTIKHTNWNSANWLLVTHEIKFTMQTRTGETIRRYQQKPSLRFLKNMHPVKKCKNSVWRWWCARIRVGRIACR